MVAEKLIDLIPSNIIMNLNEPSEIKDPSWIKPGRVAWDWWNNAQVEGVDFEGGMNDATMEYFIDFAGEFNLEYMLIDAGWYGDHRDTLADVTTSIPEIDIPHLIQYASERGVNLILWLNWKPLMLNMEKAFATYREWGIRGVKIDYMNRDDQEMVNLYHKMVVEAARHELMVDFHGAYKPAGIRRTWPNLMTREGVLGLEHLKWSDLPTADHNVTIPFTRMLAGPMDYTPGGFDHAHPGEFEIKWGEPMALGTRCHQLAMYVVYESPLQMLSDHPGNYRGQPGAEFLMEVPASWDETRAIDGEIGEFIIMARRSGVQWFLGAMTNSEPRELEVTLDFLDPGINYSATLYNDSEKTLVDANILEKIKAEVGNGQVWKLTLAPGGGFVAKISPKL
jgi:alpha-glucosidase